MAAEQTEPKKRRRGGGAGRRRETSPQAPQAPATPRAESPVVVVFTDDEAFFEAFGW